MPESLSDALIRQWSDRLGKTPLAKAVIVGLRARADEIWQHAFALLQRESPEYRNSVDDEFTKESKSHCNELLLTIIAIAAGEVRKTTPDPFDFVRIHAQWRARHHVPLVASLHAYRIAHRTYSEISQDTLGKHGTPKEIVGAQRMLSEFWLELFNHVDHVLADAMSPKMPSSSRRKLAAMCVSWTVFRAELGLPSRRCSTFARCAAFDPAPHWLSRWPSR
jgi:hypothetical protein